VLFIRLNRVAVTECWPAVTGRTSATRPWRSGHGLAERTTWTHAVQCFKLSMDVWYLYTQWLRKKTVKNLFVI